MSDYRSCAVVDAAAAQLFEMLADTGNVTRYAAPVLAVEQVRSRTLRVRAQLDGTVADTTVWRRLDRDRLRLLWGGEAHTAVRGEARVTPIGAGAAGVSVVTVSVRAPAADASLIQQALDETVRRIKRLAERLAVPP